MSKVNRILDDGDIVKLIEQGCAIDLLAKLAGVNETTIYRNYDSQIKSRELKKETEILVFKNKLFNKCMELALAGNVTMCIWLSKVLLGFRESVSVDVTNNEVVVNIYDNVKHEDVTPVEVEQE